MTLLEREARTDADIRLSTFNLERAENALNIARATIDRRGYAIARACATAAGIYILDLHGSRGPLSDRIAALCQRVRRAISES